jgi:hypothetical protein
MHFSLNRTCGARRNPVKPRRRSRPGLEPLEDRLAPAILSFNTAQDAVNPNDNVLSLREAIAVVNAGSTAGHSAAEQAQISGTLGSNDTIQLDPSLYAHGEFPLIGLQNGEFDLNRNVVLQGIGSLRFTIDAEGFSRVFVVANGVTASLSGITIKNGFSSDGLGGSGIQNNGTLTASDLNLQGNTLRGGGVGGSAIYTGGPLTASNLTILNNNSDVEGAGITVLGPNGSLRLTNSTLTNNRAVSLGGGLDIAFGATVTVTGCTFGSNVAGFGGAISDQGSPLSLTNCTLFGNAGSSNGGGIDAAFSAAVSLTNCTLSNNMSASGGGIANESSTVVLHNTIVAGNRFNGSQIPSDIAGAVDGSSSFNLIGSGDTLTGIGDGSQGNQIGTSANPRNPVLDPVLASNGGPTQTLALLPGSPAINAGDDAVLGGSSPVTTDQRGFARRSGSHVDIGAFESRPFTMTIAFGDHQTAALGAAFATRLQVTVSSPSGDPVFGGMVTFSAPGSGASAALGTNPTALTSSGAGFMTATANNTRGTYAVTASANGANSVSFTLTNDAPPTITSTSGPYTIQEGQSLTLSGSATDPENDPLTYS